MSTVQTADDTLRTQILAVESRRQQALLAGDLDTLPVRMHVGLEADGLSTRDNCPVCQENDGIRFVGSRTATLLSVALSSLFGSEGLSLSEKKSLVFTVNSFSGDDFSQVNNAYCRILNAAGQQEVARYDLSVQGTHTAQIMAKVYRHNGEWKMHAIGENANGDTFKDLVPLMTPHL